jgi:D-beta-D-heptose 7-phosphate kinase/D-beta-D-heptose 1-phosphate adenosyltransferase
VLGDPILDGFLTGAPTRLCSERPVPVLVRAGEEDRAGGAGNTAANLRTLGAQVVLLGLIGSDWAGGVLRGCLERAEVNPGGLLVDDTRPTPHKLRILAGEHYVARIDSEASGPPPPQVEQELLERLQAELDRADVVVVSDYGLGSVSRTAMWLVTRAARLRQIPVVLDAKDLLRHAGAAVTVATPNWEEAHRAAGLGEPSVGMFDPEQLEALARELPARLEAESIAVTMGWRGVLLLSRSQPAEHLRGHPVTPRNEVGAGDSLVAGVSLALAAGAPLRQALQLGMEAAAVAVAKPLTATVSLAELAERLEVASWESPPPPAGLDPELEAALADARARGRRVVFTNGVFDLLHEGHVSLLRRARALGDLLVVALNSDASARRLKGPGRPINQVEERAAVLRALDCVDHVIVFEEPTASALVAAVRPDVYVKGDDHDVDRVPEATVARELGARLVSIPRVRSISTSQIIDRVLTGARTLTPEAGGLPQEA